MIGLIESDVLFWIVFLYLVAPVVYCAAGGAFCRQWRGAVLGGLMGLPTAAVAIAGGVVLIGMTANWVSFFLQAQATAIAGGFVAGWATRFIQDD